MSVQVTMTAVIKDSDQRRRAAKAGSPARSPARDRRRRGGGGSIRPSSPRDRRRSPSDRRRRGSGRALLASRQKNTLRLTVLDTAGSTKTTLDDLSTTETVAAAVERWCDKSGEDPALTRLVRGQEALNDLSRSLEQCGITQDTELRAIQLRPQEALRAALDADADSRVRRAVQKCATAEVMVLCRTDGTTKHRRWWRLELEAAAAARQVRAVVSWSKNQDFSAAFHWKKLSSQPPKRRTATGVSDASQSAQDPTLGFTIETATAQEAVLANAASVEQRLRWLTALREVEFANALRATSGKNIAIRSSCPSR